MKGQPILLGALVFFISAFISWLVASASELVAVVIVSCGLVLGIIAFFRAALEKRVGQPGDLMFRAPGVEVSIWEARTDRPIRTVIPDHPTDSSANRQAKQLCQEGRDLIAAKTVGQQVNLDLAYDKFLNASVLDPTYWEPRINVAQVLLLKGRLDASFAWAADVRTTFSEVPLAFAKAGLILAEILERRMDPDASQERHRSEFRKISEILKDSLEKCPGHLTTRYSLGRVLLLSGEEKQVIEEFLRESRKYEDFTARFNEVLRATGLQEKFEKEFPDLQLS